jgi:hypothetical protein
VKVFKLFWLKIIHDLFTTEASSQNPTEIINNIEKIKRFVDDSELNVDFYVYVGRDERKRGAKKEYIEALPKSTYRENAEKTRQVST